MLSRFQPRSTPTNTPSAPSGISRPLVPDLASIPQIDLVPSSPPKGTRDEDDVDLVPVPRPVPVPSPNGHRDTNQPTGTPSRPPIIGDDGYLEQLFAAFEAGHVTAGEWKQLSRLHQKLEAVA